MARNRFTNPVDGGTYDWIINHTEEEESGKTRQVTRAGLTDGVGMVRQQGEDGALVLHLRGTILDRSQYQAMWIWFQVSRSHTIYFTDFDGQSYEVQITSFQPRRIRKLTSPRRDPTTPNHYWTYSMDMEVINFLTGDLAASGVTP